MGRGVYLLLDWLYSWEMQDQLLGTECSLQVTFLFVRFLDQQSNSHAPHLLPQVGKLSPPLPPCGKALY